MSITLSPAKATYLARVSDGLVDLTAEDRHEVIQDLEAHLAELAEDAVGRTLGTPEDFVAEFRRSAGLAEPSRVPRFDRLRRVRDRLEESANRLAGMVHWPTLRPIWVWTRGWLLISAWALLDGQGFGRFPIPSIGNSPMTGLALTVLATWLSVWLETSPPSRAKGFTSRLYSFGTGFALLVIITNPYPGPTAATIDEGMFYIDRLTGVDGQPIENIYAYDLEGQPVDVLLFDQDGRPLLSLPTYVYDDAELTPGLEEIAYDNGAVTFRRDQFGRVISNLYPLQLSRYDDYGRLSQVPPPSLGFPAANDGEPPSGPGEVTTTITRGE